MGKKLFVGGLAWATDDAGLRAAFEQFGVVTDAKVILDRETGRSRGFGFVTMQEDDSADQAMKELDGAELDGRSIRVNEAEERQRGGGGGARRGGGGGFRGGGGGGGGGGFRDRGGGGGFGGDESFDRGDRGHRQDRGRGGRGGRGRGGGGGSGGGGGGGGGRY